MTVYRGTQSTTFKWLLALIIFVLAMTLTFSDVYGLSLGTKSSSSVNTAGTNTGTLTTTTKNQPPANLVPVIGKDDDGRIGSDCYPSENGSTSSIPDPTAVPEPSTILLLASGLGLLRLTRFTKHS